MQSIFDDISKLM